MSDGSLFGVTRNSELLRHLERDDPRKHLDPGIYRAIVTKTEFGWDGRYDERGMRVTHVSAIHYALPTCGDWQWRISEYDSGITREFLDAAHRNEGFDFERG